MTPQPQQENGKCDKCLNVQYLAGKRTVMHNLECKCECHTPEKIEGDWSERFDSEFPQREIEGRIDEDTWYGSEPTPKRIKSFISSERQRLLEEVIGEIEKISCDGCKYKNVWCSHLQTAPRIINLIKKKI